MPASWCGKSAPPPDTRSLELIDFIRAEAAPDQQSLITDLFDKITYYTVVVDGVPAEAGIDPYNKLIDRVPSDNRTQVSIRRIAFDAG